MSVAGGVDWVVTMAAMHAWVTAGSGLPAGSIAWGGGQKVGRPAAPGITMKLSTIDDIGSPWLYSEDNPLVVSTKTISAVSVVGNSLTSVAHTMLTGDGPFQFSSTLTLPAPLEEDTDYWVIKLTADTFRLADTFVKTGGAQPAGVGNPVTPIVLLDVGSGTITLDDTADTLRAGQELVHLAQGLVRAVLTLECHTDVAVGLNMAVAVLRRIAARSVFPSQDEILDTANIGLTTIDKVRAVRGRLDAMLFEPRAVLDVFFCLGSEDSEFGTIVQTVEVTSDLLGTTETVGP